MANQKMFLRNKKSAKKRLSTSNRKLSTRKGGMFNSIFGSKPQNAAPSPSALPVVPPSALPVVPP